MKTCATYCPSRGSQAAFSFFELLVLLSLIGLLTVFFGTALARTQPPSRALRCLNNLRQLTVGWQMYAEDNRGRLAPNYHGAELAGGVTSGWGQGWLDFTTATDNTNTALLVDERYAKLAKYYSRAADLFQCPNDHYVSSAQRARGWTRRARSYSANINIGEGNAEVGPWSGTIYKHITNNAQFFYPGPADTWIYTEELPDSINDPAFFNPNPTFIDLPAVHHNRGGMFSFGDGHAEVHQWTGSLTNLPLRVGAILPSLGRPGDPDVHWVCWRAGRISPNSY